MVAEVLTARALNRAVLARQLLLNRADLPVVPAVERVLGLNAQDPNLPYLALWTRLQRFALGDLTAAIEDRRLVRSTLMRSTQHLVSAPDFRLLRPALAPLLRRVQRNSYGRRTDGIDLAALVVEARELLAGGRVLTRTELGRSLAQRRPGSDPVALGWTVQYLEPVVHPAPSGTWNSRGPTPFVLASDWLGADLEGGPGRDTTAARLRRIVRRYLAAFGPATVADMRAWSGLGGLRGVVESMRAELPVVSDESGREMFDLESAPRPDGDLPAPVRFLPEFDAPLLAYADRTRMMTEDVRRQVCVGSGVASTVLIDGTVTAIWSVSRTDQLVTLTVQPLRPLGAPDRADVEAEGARLLAFTHPLVDHEIRVMAPR